MGISIKKQHIRLLSATVTVIGQVVKQQGVPLVGYVLFSVRTSFLGLQSTMTLSLNHLLKPSIERCLLLLLKWPGYKTCWRSWGYINKRWHFYSVITCLQCVSLPTLYFTNAQSTSKWIFIMSESGLRSSFWWLNTFQLHYRSQTCLPRLSQVVFDHLRNKLSVSVSSTLSLRGCNGSMDSETKDKAQVTEVKMKPLENLLQRSELHLHKRKKN